MGQSLSEKFTSFFLQKESYRIISESERVSCSGMSNSLRPMDCSLPGFSVHGILQARLLEWLAIPFSRDLPNPGLNPDLLH